MPKPSFGCLVCRRRKIKCDERPGGCLNCERRGIPCSGYQDHFDVLHRMRGIAATPQQHGGPSQVGPYQQPAQFAAQSSAQGALAASSSRTPQDHPPTAEAFAAVQAQPGQFIPYDHDDTALALFYSTYCVDGWTISSTDYIRQQGCLFAAIKVLGNTMIARLWSMPNGSEMLARSYMMATRSLNSSLQSPTEATKDSTLLATIILTAVEIKLAPSSTLDYWHAHAEGAATLLAMRGQNQVSSRLGSALYFQVASITTSNRLVAARPIPAPLVQLRSQLTPQVIDAEHPLWKLQGAMFHLTDFIASVRLDEIDANEAAATCETAMAIYAELLAVFANAGPEWERIHTPSSSFRHLFIHEHSYRSVLSTQVWNAQRTGIVVLLTVVARISLRFGYQLQLSPEVEQFVRNAGNNINQTALDALASVTQPLQLIGDRAAHHAPPQLPIERQQTPDLFSERYVRYTPVFAETVADIQRLPFMHGCLLQWAIYFAVDCEFVEMETRVALWRVLDEAARAMHVRQWQLLAEKLQSSLGQ